MATLISALSLIIALAQERVVETLKSERAAIKKWGGYILIVVGLWLIVLAIWAKLFAGVFPV